MKEIAKIKFGKTRFEFFMTNKIEKLLKNKKFETKKIIPTASSWYVQVLKEIDSNFKQNKKIEVLFFEREPDKNFNPEFIGQSPLRTKDKTLNIKFGVRKDE